MLDIKDAEIEGDPKARLGLVELANDQCPPGARHAKATFPRIDAEYVESGTLRSAVLDAPGGAFPLAFTAAEATHGAGERG